MCNFPTAAAVLIKTVPLELVGEIKVFIFLHNSTCLQSRAIQECLEQCTGYVNAGDCSKFCLSHDQMCFDNQTNLCLQTCKCTHSDPSSASVSEVSCSVPIPLKS